MMPPAGCADGGPATRQAIGKAARATQDHGARSHFASHVGEHPERVSAGDEELHGPGTGSRCQVLRLAVAAVLGRAVTAGAFPVVQSAWDGDSAGGTTVG
ncbi:hypothetical protein Ate02nite_94850 [Paractinoplanes tereljensis]|uniref:Uncharacterized protein n=1 Tax=Paractinoplanes tereljensis TaxID=571912 RepID=A0A919NWY1_9ACTN|nr:hypothetical protein Ate02nite_94850 [Actinoplanes tereljensis]